MLPHTPPKVVSIRCEIGIRGSLSPAEVQALNYLNSPRALPDLDPAADSGDGLSAQADRAVVRDSSSGPADQCGRLDPAFVRCAALARFDPLQEFLFRCVVTDRPERLAQCSFCGARFCAAHIFIADDENHMACAACRRNRAE